MRSKTSIGACLMLAAMLPACAAAQPFTVVALPDTQNYSSSYPDIFHAQTQWIVDNREAFDIAFVTHLGDIVNNGPDLGQWVNAKAAMDRLLDADIPHGLCMGNHDNQFPGIDPDGVNYLANFGPQVFEDRPWYRGASPSGLSNYQVVEAGGYEFLFLHIEVDSRPAEIAWAQTVLEANPDKPTAVTIHRYVYDYRFVAGRFNPFIYQYIDGLYYENSVPADELWATLIKPNRQVYAVFCGHVDAEYYEVKHNDVGLPVYEVLADFQSSSPMGGLGWLRLMEYDTENESIRMRTYSPVVDGGSFRTIEQQIESYTFILTDFADDAAEVLSPLLDDLDEDKVDFVLQLLFSQPGTFTAIVAALEAGDPITTALLAGIAGVEVDELASILGEFPWDDLNDDFIAVADACGPELIGPLLRADLDGFAAVLGADNGQKIMQGFLMDPRRATDFTLKVPFAAYVGELPPCTGDINGDGARDSADLNAVLANFGTTGDPAVDGGVQGDVDGDGDVDNTDLNLMLGQFGDGC